MTKHWLTVLVALWGLAACGGGGSGSPDTEGNRDVVATSDQTPAETLAPDGAGDTTSSDPTLVASPSSIDFGVVAADTSERRTVQVRHAGTTGTVTLLSAALEAGESGAFSLEGDLPATLGPGDEAALTVAYTPTTAGEDEDVLIVSHDLATQRALRIPLSGRLRYGALCFRPESVHLEDIVAPVDRPNDIDIRSCGSAAVQIVGVAVSEDSSPTFTITAAPPVPTRLAPGLEVTLRVLFSPRDVGTYEGTAVVTFVGPNDEELSAELPLYGNVVDRNGPRLTPVPAQLDLGPVLGGRSATETLLLRNTGNEALHIQSLRLDPDSHEGARFNPAWDPTAPIQANEELTVMVALALTDPLENHTPDTVATLVVESDDPSAPVVTIPILAYTPPPQIETEPETEVAFGEVGLSATGRHDLIVRNIGGVPLLVEELRLTQDHPDGVAELTIESVAGFADEGAERVGSLAPGGSGVISVAFSNLTGTTGTIAGSLTITSNDPLRPELEIALTATRTPLFTSDDCELRIQPELYDFGAQSCGGTAQGTIALLNTGRRRCLVGRLEIARCRTSWFGETCYLDQLSDRFFPNVPDLPVEIGPGTALELDVLFDPDPNEPSQIVDDTFLALVWAEFRDPDGPTPDLNLTVPDTTEGTPSPNLFGACGQSDAYALPEEVVFPDTVVGCAAQSQRVEIFRRTDAPLRVESLALEGCGEHFMLVDPPEIPPEGLLVDEEAGFSVLVGFAPTAVGDFECSLQIATNAMGVSDFGVHVAGSGTEAGVVDETVEWETAPAVDILFVVDDSGSMCEEQQRLRDNFSAFIQSAQQWGNSFRIGVTTTCVHNEDACDGVGRLRSEFYPPDRWSDNDTWDTFLTNVMVGCNGGSDIQEAALEGAFRALSRPNTSETETGCQQDSDCEVPLVCLPDRGACTGFNAGFLRADAALEIVVLSDEEDQSDAPLDFYLAFFQSLKRHLGKGGARLHAIVGDESDGCRNPTSGTNAQAGDRYIYVARRTSGVVGSICDDSFADTLASIGEEAFTPAWEHRLSRQPISATIAVDVNGEPCETGWYYAPLQRSVVFQSTGPCTPEDGDIVTFHYEPACLSP